MSAARKELQEAERYLRLMAETQAEADTFRRNLGCFLDAFRRVIPVIEQESGSRPGFSDWQRRCREAFKRSAGMKLLITERAMNIRKLPESDETPLAESVSIATSCSEEIMVLYEPPPLHPSQQQWYFAGIPGGEVLTICRECLDSLKAMELDWEGTLKT